MMAKFETIIVGADSNDLHEALQIAVVNMPVFDTFVEASYLESPIITRARLSLITELLNSISRYRNGIGKKINLVVFPEVCIPHAWEGMLVDWARRHDIGIVAGLEHRIDREKKAHNQVLAALPFRTSYGSISCIPIRRLKKFYSPEEEFYLKNLQLKIPNTKSVRFQLIRWRGASFAIYNCYELTSIEHRGIFKGKVDFIIGTEFNKDVNYFSNIVESVARDIHCYVIQVNDSQFGDSRVVTPARTETMNPLRIKGGDNLSFLTMRLDLARLRDHQRRGYGLQKDSKEFKITPPGLRKSDVVDRINFGIKQKI